MEPEEKSSFLTNRQKEFAKLIVDGVYSNAECARRAGYSQKVAVKYAHKLLNGKDFPLVPEHIAELRQERERKYGVTLIGQLKRLSDLSHNAEAEGQFSAAINAEKIRASLGGLTVDRRHFYLREVSFFLDAVNLNEKGLKFPALWRGTDLASCALFMFDRAGCAGSGGLAPCD